MSSGWRLAIPFL